jgi:16S rRNA G1207 methylase RsmC
LIYQKAVDFADAICDRTERFGCGYGFLALQLNRAALAKLGMVSVTPRSRQAERPKTKRKG